MFVARHCYFFKTYFLILWCIYEPQVEAVAPTFLVPIASTAPRDVDENSAKDVSILTVEGQDGDGDVLTFSIFSQNPMSPPFELESNTGLFKTPNGLNAETAQSFTFVFSVSDGTSSVDSVPFTVNINDVNDNAPQFVGTPYEASLLDSVINGTSVFIVNATDADVTPATITYHITGGNTNNTFAIVSNGNITTNATLTGGSSFTLNVEASDNTFTSTTTVTITVNEDFCTPSPCENSGTCTLTGSSYNCSCSDGFIGQNCSQVDYCATNPCQNGGVCNNGATTHTCTCPSGYTGTNCTEIVDNCASNPCQNGGTCNNGFNFYNCTCPEGYSGTNCEIKDECETCCCCICRHIPTDLRIVCCIICVIVSIIIALLVIGICLCCACILHKKKKIDVHKVPVIGKCFEKKNAKGDEYYNNRFEPSQTEQGYESVGLKHTNRADNKSDGGQEESPAHKKTPPENSEKHEPLLGH